MPLENAIKARLEAVRKENQNLAHDYDFAEDTGDIDTLEEIEHAHTHALGYIAALSWVLDRLEAGASCA